MLEDLIAGCQKLAEEKEAFEKDKTCLRKLTSERPVYFCRSWHLSKTRFDG